MAEITSSVDTMSQAEREELRRREQQEKDRQAAVERKNSAEITRQEDAQRERTQNIVQNRAPQPDPTLMTRRERITQEQTNAEQGIMVNQEQAQQYQAEQDRARQMEEERLALARRKKVVVRKGADRIPSDRGIEELVAIHGAQNVEVDGVLVSDIDKHVSGDDRDTRDADAKAYQDRIAAAADEREARKAEDEDLLLRDEIDKPLISQNGQQLKSLGGFEDKVRLAENVDKRPVNMDQIARNRQDHKPLDTPLASPMAEKAVGETRGDILEQERKDKQAAQDRKNEALAAVADNPAPALQQLQDSKDDKEKALDNEVEHYAQRVKAGEIDASQAAAMIYAAVPISERRATQLEIEKRVKYRVDKLNAA